MRYLIYGAGGIGGCIGAALHVQGHAVQLIARGAHLAALQRDGLQFRTPTRTHRLTIPAVAAPSQLTIDDDDVVLLAMKGQHTHQALTALRSATAAEPVVVCAQNGVANERSALRLFARVYGMEVFMPTTHLQPGEIEVHSEGVYGLLDIGRYPDGVDASAEAIAGDLQRAGFASSARTDVMAWKHRKLLHNLGNALQVLIGESAATVDISRLLRAEAQAVFAAAGLRMIDDASYRARIDLLDRGTHSHARRQGGSTLQSVLRGADGVETDYLNGEIVLLGRLHGIATPVNALVQRLTARKVAGGAAPGSLDGAALLTQAREATATARP